MILSRLGKYRIVRWLGGGQFGDVFLAQDTILEKEFALKIARMRPQDILMLRDEARLLASLDHPNIVRFYNIDSIENRFIMVLEYVPGPSLRKLLEPASSGFPIPRAIEIIRQVLQAIDCAHRRGVIHRDLKPENILVTGEDLVKVTDFGLARFIKPGSYSASIAGTPVYMAPEAWKGRFLPQSDLYSVGAVCYELLAGRPPFLGDSLEELRLAILRSPPTPLHLLNPRIPRGVEELVLELLSKRPELRPRSAEEVLNRLAPRKGVRIAPTPVGVRLDHGVALTPQQEAVLASSAPQILLLGSAGTGKTTTLTYKVAQVIRNLGLDPEECLVACFTRKASLDLRSRLERLLGHPARGLWLDTCHGIGYRILKREAGRLDIPEEFEVVDPKSVRLYLPKIGPNKLQLILAQISRWKAEGLDPGEAQGRARSTWEVFCAEVYQRYQRTLKEQNLVDFEDLIRYPLKLLKEAEDLREFYSSKFRWVFVDELQDLTPAQYELLRTLASYHKNCLFTGDPDQCIYEWRGARPQLIEEVKRAFPEIVSFNLTQSFRLPQAILSPAQNLIAHNRHRSQLQLFSTREEGKVELYPADSEEDEAFWIAGRISRMVERGRPFSDIAILYRLNSQSRIFEEALAQSRIPYLVVGADRFYEREEVRYLVELLRAVNPYDPGRLIPPLCWLFRIKEADALHYLQIRGGELQIQAQEGRIKKGLKESTEALSRIGARPREFSPAQVIELLLELSGYRRRLARQRTPSALQQLANLEELLKAAQKFGPGELDLFSDHVALLEDLELVDWGRNAVKLLTVHSAKGFEFPVVFLTGLIEGIFPLTKNLAETRALEEERRLCFVAATRAQEQLYLSYPKRRYKRPTEPSRFIPEMLGM